MDAVDTHVNHDRARFHHVCLHKSGGAHRRDQNVRATAVRGDIARERVAERDGGVGVFRFLDQNGRHRLADNVAAAQHDDFRAFDFDLRPDEQFVHARRRARQKTT